LFVDARRERAGTKGWRKQDWDLVTRQIFPANSRQKLLQDKSGYAAKFENFENPGALVRTGRPRTFPEMT
jgi:hypothetical protein